MFSLEVVLEGEKCRARQARITIRSTRPYRESVYTLKGKKRRGSFGDSKG
jgi:hypothetical protein